jgi:hypothetical protein
LPVLKTKLATPARVDFRKIVVYSFFPFPHPASNEISPNPKNSWAKRISRYFKGKAFSLGVHGGTLMMGARLTQD